MASLGEQRELRHSGSFVGRERELAELRVALADMTAGHGHLFLLSGEPGIGKTRLADEFGRQAVAGGVRVAWGRCWEGGGAPAYWPWIQILRACLRDADAEQRAAIFGSEATPRLAQDIAQLLPELHATATQAAKPPGPRPSDPEQARFHLFESVATVLRNVGRNAPLVIVIDDLHDADHPSLQLLKFIAGQSKEARILVVGSCRDTEVRQSKELTRLIGELSREGHSLPIVGLSQAEVGEFVESSAGKKADDKLVADLYQATDGNPLFVDGVVRLLVAEGKLDRARLDRSAFSIPDGVRESIRRQLLKLSEETNLMLSIASVIGNDFETRLLAQVSQSAAEQITERMGQAIRAGIVVGGATGDLRHRFSHALIRESLYEDLAANRRIELHSQIGSVIEEIHKDDLKPHLATLAHHFRAGGVADKAIDYSILAGEAAEAVFAYNEAISHLRPALALSEIHDDRYSARRAGVLLRLGHIEVFFENRDAGVANLEAALKIYEQIGDDQHAGEIHSHFGRVFHAASGPQMNLSRSLLHLQRAKVLLEQTGDQYALAMVYWGLSIANQAELRINEAMTAAQRGMDIFGLLGERERWTEVAGQQVALLMVKGKQRQAAALLNEISAEAADFVNPDAFLIVMASCAYYHSLMTDHSGAAHFYRRSIDRPGVMPTRRAVPLEFLAFAEMSMGNLAGAKRLAAGIRPAFRARIEFYEGDWKSARATMQQVIDWARHGGAKWEELNTLVYVVELLRVIGDYQGATAALERALSLYPPDDLFWEIRVRPQAVMLCFDTGEFEKATEHLEICHEILAQGEDWLGIAGQVWRAEGIVAAIQGRFEQSDRYFEKAREIQKRYSLVWYEAETLHYWGRALLHKGEPHRAHEKLDAAIKIYRQHGGGQSWIDRVEADRQRTPPPRTDPRARKNSTSDELLDRAAVFRKEGDFWTITYGGRTFRLHDMKGLAYIAQLLAHPGERIHVRDLLATVEGSAAGDSGIRMATGRARQDGLEVVRELGDAGEALDLTARAQYRRELGELRAELENAEQQNDPGRAERARAELEFVSAELTAGVGRGGRGRKAAAHSERARGTVTKSIRASLERIRQNDTKLGHHLATCIRTGYLCAYLPDPERKPSWQI